MTRTLWVGCTGADVAAVQDALNQIGANAALPGQQTALPLLVPDGVFGNKTYIRVKDFQHTNGLVEDGVVGPTTLGRVQDLLPAVHPGMSTSRPAGGLAGGGGKTYGSGSKTYDSASKTSNWGSKTYNSGSKTYNSGSKTFKT